MTTRTRTAILLLALVVAALMLCGCDDVAGYVPTATVEVTP